MTYHQRRKRHWITDRDCKLDEFTAQVEDTTHRESVPHAADVISNVPIYDATAVVNLLDSDDDRRSILSEWAGVFLDGPGALVVKRAFADTAIIDDATEVFEAIMDEERRTGTGSGDHFAPPGHNTRIWNSHEKLCVAAPRVFARYYANPMIPPVCQSWLGPAFQITTQVNAVHPGGKAQTPHRDYHMGFQSAEELEQYPAHAHHLSAALTLQGAVAHCDMPVETGPTKFLPFSQRYEAGYFAVYRPEIRDYFEAHFVQLPLEKGDALFFNPALFHAAGSNITENTTRIANLMQINSGYGRAIETVDRLRICKALYPVLLEMAETDALDTAAIDNVIAASAEGYPFPVNLDLDPPVDGMAPKSQQALLREALVGRWPPDRLARELDAQAARRLTH